MVRMPPMKIPGGSEVWIKGEVPGIPVGPDRWPKAEVETIITDEDVWLERKIIVEREEPRPAFLPSRHVWSRRLKTVMWVLLGVAVGFLLGTMSAVIAYKATEPMPVAVRNLAARQFCDRTPNSSSMAPFAKQCAQGAPFANTFVTLQTSGGTLALQVLGIAVFDGSLTNCHVELHTISSQIQILKSSKQIVYTRYDGFREELDWNA
eukprot:GEMP01037127.1.p1 GENE.GEMP01037127.1~~GEMP01037127.1.p1  ORF type:complete len:207 (+),score=30.67 GEMP01037127.1:114-734(+)